MTLRKGLCILLLTMAPSIIFAQVKIGDTTGSINPKVVLELKDTARGFLLPRMTQTQMNAIAAPPDGLLVFNNTAKSIYQYKLNSNIWMPIRSDSSDWYLDTSSAKLYLKYGLINKDSIYYHTAKKKFLFADTRFYGTSSGGVFNLDEGNSDKYIFKVTASKFNRDPVNLNSANIYSVFEVDNDTVALSHPFESSYTGIGVDATVTPSATQKINEIYGNRTFSTFAGKDSLNAMYGLFNLVTTKGKGYNDLVMGINNTVSVRDSVSSSGVGVVYGIFNNLVYSSPLGTPRVISDVYGYYLGMSTAYANKVDGSAYGLYLRNINASSILRNFAIFTNKGVNRLGDSLLVTEGAAQKPRAVFDINSTTAMILPAGTTLQRPTTLYNGMLRYNTDLASPEAYTSAGWVSVKNPVIASTALLDPPLIADNSTGTVNYAFTGVAIGNTVTISPATALPSGIVIAWANVSAVNQVTIGFANFSGAPVDLPAQSFYIKVVQ